MSSSPPSSPRDRACPRRSSSSSHPAARRARHASLPPRPRTSRRTSRPRSACASPPPSSSPCRRSPLEPPISTDRCQLSQEVHASPRRRGGPVARGPRSTLASGADTAWAELRLSSLLTALSSRIHVQLCSAFYICEPVELRTLPADHDQTACCTRAVRANNFGDGCVCPVCVLACGWGPALPVWRHVSL